MTAAELSKAVETVVLESARKDARIAELEMALSELYRTFLGDSSPDWQAALARCFKLAKERA